MIDEPGVGRNLVAAHGDHRHRFRAAGDDHFGAAGLNSLGGHGDGLQPGRAETIDRHGRDFNGQAGAQGGDARDVHPLLAFGHGAAEDDVFDFFRIELRHAVERGLDRDGGKVVGRVERSVPLKARPTGVRRAETITTSLMKIVY